MVMSNMDTVMINMATEQEELFILQELFILLDQLTTDIIEMRLLPGLAHLIIIILQEEFIQDLT